METLRTLKGPSTGEVSVHLVARGSPGSGPHLPTTAFIIPGGPSQGSWEEEHPHACPSRCGSRGGDGTFTCLHMRGGFGVEPPGSPVSCLTGYLFTASSATLGLPSSSLDVPCFPREPIHVGAPQRVPGSVPVMATVLPQLSAGPAASSSASTVRLLGWTEAEAPAPPPGGGLRVSVSGHWRGPVSAAVGLAGPEVESGGSWRGCRLRGWGLE